MSGRDDQPPVGPELERRLRDAVAREGARQAAAPAADAPGPEALLDALSGRLPEAERVRVLDRAARTAEGRRELATLRVALGAADEAWPARPASWWTRPAAAAAALVLAAGLGGGLWWRSTHAGPDADPLRSAGGEARVILVAPEVDAAAGAATLAWRAVPGALGYDVEVLAADGALVHRATTRDTTLGLPPAAVPAPGAAYEWWVRARLADGSARRSATGRIRGR